MWNNTKISNEIQVYRMNRHLMHEENKAGRYFTHEEVQAHHIYWISRFSTFFRQWFIKAPKFVIHRSNGKTHNIVGKKALKEALTLYSRDIKMIERVKE